MAAVNMKNDYHAKPLIFTKRFSVGFGHHLKNGGLKTPQKGSKKMSEISLFEGKQQIIIFMINPNSQF